MIVNGIISNATYNTTKLKPNIASTEISSTCYFIPFKLLGNKTNVFVTAVLIHIFTLHQQMADTLSVLVLDPLHTIMQGTVIEVTVAGALIMKPKCCNEDCYLLPKDTVMLVDTYRCCRGTGLTDLQVTTVRLVLLPDHLGSKLILTICNQFIATPFSHNTALCCKITTKLLSQQCSVRPLC